MPPSDILRQLRNLDQSSPDFPGHLTSIFDDEGYKECVTRLQGDDLEQLIDQLYNVCPLIAPAVRHRTWRRPSTFSAPPVLHSGRACENSERCVVSGW